MEVRTAAVTRAGTDAIRAKWRRLGGAAVVGDPTAPVRDAPGDIAQYRTYEHGVIVYSEDFGAAYLTQTIFDKWISLDGATGPDGTPMLTYVGPPIADFETITTGTKAEFERGRIIVDAAGSYVVYGAIYERYSTLARVLAAPRSDEAAEAGGGRFQRFENGEIHWSPAVGALAITGPVLERWRALGGPESALGFPSTDTVSIYDSSRLVEGQTSRFERGVIYYSPDSGAWELPSGILLNAYESRFGGPMGGLGFPVGTERVAGSGDRYVDCQYGVVVFHMSNDIYRDVYAFGQLNFWYQRVAGYGDDCEFGICGAQDVYTWLRIDNGRGNVVDGHRNPPSGDYDGDGDVFESIRLGTASSQNVITVKLDGRDSDPPPMDDDILGTINVTYSIDNLWGMFEGTEHSASHGENSMTATFNIRNYPPYDMNGDFRKDRWWSFHNFTTETLSWEQYAATFEDVEPEENMLVHPFNETYYQLAFKGIASNGNCLGMALESVYAQIGWSPWTEPLHRFFPDTQHGERLDEVADDAAHRSLIRELNIKQGYQLGHGMVQWVIDTVGAGGTHDPNGVYSFSKAAHEAGHFPMISIFDTYLFGKAHAVRPYGWNDDAPCVNASSRPPCKRIVIADSNRPWVDDSPPASLDFIEIDADNDYVYGDYSGGNWGGGRMFAYPFDIMAYTPYTPIGIPQRLWDGIVWAVRAGSMNQVTDENGRTLFRPGQPGVPTAWDDLVEDPAARIPNLVPMMVAADGPLPVQLYVGKRVKGATHVAEVVPAAGTAPGAPYEAVFDSAKLSAKLSIPGTPGKSERISTERIGTAERAIGVEIPVGAQHKALTWTIAGANKHRWSEFSGLGMEPAQKIRMRTANAGYQVLVDNTGPATTATLRFSSGRGATPVTIGQINIPAGSSTVDLQAPRTTLTTSNVVMGNNGWLVAPVTVTLAAQDMSGAGIDVIEYSNDGAVWTTYTGPFQYTNQGVTTLYYRARDLDSNEEVAKSALFKIDMNSPGALGAVSVSGGVALTYSVSDAAPGSGVAGLHILQGTTSPIQTFVTAPSGTVALSGACSAVEFWGEDVAGNMSVHTVLGDSVGPAFAVAPLPIVTNVCTAGAGLSLGTVSAVDDCGPVTVTNDAPSKFPVGVTTVTWIARDVAGNTTVRTQTVTAELAGDTSCCPTGSRILMGTSNNDTLTGTAGDDCILGLGGQDIIRGGGGNDTLSGGDGDDQLWGGAGSDSLSGGPGQDKLYGEAGNDVCLGGGGDDQMWGGGNDDQLLGGQGKDMIYGEDGNDRLQGDADDDALNGGLGNDYLAGGIGRDTLAGGGGTDQCVQDGMDTLNACLAVSP